jgi:putative redox protein
MVNVQIVYRGDLHCAATHGPSGATLDTDAPKDNQGRGEAFSPTDLVAAALGTCILTTIAIRTRRLDLALAGATASVTKEMVATPTRRIGRLAVEVTIPVPTTPEQRAEIERIAHTCPVHASLHPDVQVPITFRWAE